LGLLLLGSEGTDCWQGCSASKHESSSCHLSP